MALRKSCFLFVASHPTKKGAIDRGGGVFNERRPRHRPFILPLKGRRSEGQWRGEGAAKQVAGRVHSVSSESRNCSSTKVCRTDAKPSLTFACLPAASLHTLGSPPIFTSPFLLRPLPFSVSKLLLSFPLGDVRSPQRRSTKPPLFIGSRWTRLTVVL